MMNNRELIILFGLDFTLFGGTVSFSVHFRHPGDCRTFEPIGSNHTKREGDRFRTSHLRQVAVVECRKRNVIYAVRKC